MLLSDEVPSTEMTLAPSNPFAAENGSAAAGALVHPEDSDSSYQGVAYYRNVRETGTWNEGGLHLWVRNKVLHEEVEASEAFACQRETSVLVVVAVAVAEEADSVLLVRSVYQGFPILEGGLHAVTVVELHYYTNTRVVEVHEEVQVHHVASAAVAAGCTEKARHTADVLREEVHETGTPGWDGDDNTAELRTRSTAVPVSAIPCVRLRQSWWSVY
jgi:hypothetical protein